MGWDTGIPTLDPNAGHTAVSCETIQSWGCLHQDAGSTYIKLGGEEEEGPLARWSCLLVLTARSIILYVHVAFEVVTGGLRLLK